MDLSIVTNIFWQDQACGNNMRVFILYSDNTYEVRKFTPITYRSNHKSEFKHFMNLTCLRKEKFTKEKVDEYISSKLNEWKPIEKGL